MKRLLNSGLMIAALAVGSLLTPPAIANARSVSVYSSMSLGYSSYGYGYPSYSSLSFGSYPGFYTSFGYFPTQYPRVYLPARYPTPALRVSSATNEWLMVVGESKRIAYEEAMTSNPPSAEPAPFPPEPIDIPQIQVETE